MSESKLDELAWRCLTKPDAVEIDDIGLTQEDVRTVCDLRDGRLFFRNSEEAGARAIRHIQQAFIEPATAAPSTFFKVLNRCWLDAGEARQDNLSGRALAQLHNTGRLDAVHMAIEAIRGGSDVFSVSRVMTNSLPLFDEIDVESLSNLCRLLHPKMKNDLAQGFIYGAIGEWMKSHPAAIDEVVADCLAVPDEALAPLLRTALIQGAACDQLPWLARIHELVANGSPAISLPAIEALGLVDWSNTDVVHVAKAASVIRAGLQSGDESVLVSSACAGLNLVNTAHEQHALIDEIVALDRAYIVRLVGDHLGYRREHLNAQPWYLDKIALLASKANQNKGSYDGVDVVLSNLFSSEHRAACLQWLHTWAAANADDPRDFQEEFPQLFELLSASGEALGALLAKWLTHDEIGVQKAARQVLDDVDLHEKGYPCFPPSILDGMTPQRLLLLVRRVLGNVLREGQLISLIWSLTGTTAAESRTYDLVYQAMVNFVGRDYPAAAKTHLESIVAAEGETPLGRLAQAILAAMTEYLDALDALPMIEELRPLAEHRQRFAKERRRQMNEAFDEANKNSIWRQIATTIPLKAGRSSFSIRNGKVGEKLHLSSMSHSIAIPRSEAIDRVGSDLRRVQFNLGREDDKE